MWDAYGSAKHGRLGLINESATRSGSIAHPGASDSNRCAPGSRRRIRVWRHVSGAAWPLPAPIRSSFSFARARNTAAAAPAGPVPITTTGSDSPWPRRPRIRAKRARRGKFRGHRGRRFFVRALSTRKARVQSESRCRRIAPKAPPVPLAPAAAVRRVSGDSFQTPSPFAENLSLGARVTQDDPEGELQGCSGLFRSEPRT